MISRKYKFHVLKRKIADFFNPQKFLLARSNAQRHSSSIWVVILNLTIFCVRKILLILEDKLFVELSITSSLTDPFCLQCRVLPWCLFHRVISVNVSPGHQRDRHKYNITLLLTFHLSVSYYFFGQSSVNYCFLGKYQLTVNPIRTLYLVTLAFHTPFPVSVKSVFSDPREKRSSSRLRSSAYGKQSLGAADKKYGTLKRTVQT